MYQALYRKWRPKTFDQVVGQQHVTETLKNQILSGKIGHAYLFTGSRGTGKTTCAKILAKAVNCRNPQNGNPCLECDLCRGIEEGRILDVVEQDAASNNRVDDVRALREETNFTPVEAKYRVYILDEAHMLTTGAVNALLKIMEEPPEHVIFILATTEVHKIPETLLSRCQRFDFKRVPAQLIAQRLTEIAGAEQAAISPEAALRIGELADGGMRDAISLLDQSLSVSRQLQVEQVNRVAGVVDKSHLFSLAQGVMENDCRRILEQIHQLYQNSFDLERLCRDLHGHFRDLMLAKTIPAQQLERYVAGSPETREQLTAQAEGFSLPALLHAMTALQQAQTRMTRTGDARMELELCLVELASQKADCSLEGLLRRVEALEQLARQGQAPGRQSPGQSVPVQQSSLPAQKAASPVRQAAAGAQKDALASGVSHQQGPASSGAPEQKAAPAEAAQDPSSLLPPDGQIIGGGPVSPEELPPWEEPGAPLPEEPAFPENAGAAERVPVPAAPPSAPAASPAPQVQKAAPAPEEGLAEFGQWEQVLEALSATNPALRGALNGSRAYQKGADLMLIDGSSAFILLIKNSDTTRESLREALRSVTGKKFRLGPYKPQKNQGAAPSPDRFAALEQKAQELGIQFDTL